MIANYATVLFLPSHTKNLEYNYVEFEEAGLLIGISLFAFEAINTVVNVRRATQLPSNMLLYIKATFTLASVFFILFGASYHLTYGQTMKKIAFDYYINSKILHSLKFLVMLNPLFSIPFNVISTVELFEKLKPLSFLTRDRALNLSAPRILLTRQIALFFIFMLSLISQDMSLILDTVGSLFGPALGLILPVISYYQVVIYLNYVKNYGIPYSCMWKCHDYLFLVGSCVFMGLGVKKVLDNLSKY